MKKMINLVRNENMKLYHRFSTWFMICSVILLVLVVGLILKFSPLNKEVNTEWKAQLKVENQSLKQNLKHKEGMPETLVKSYEKTLKINEYRLEKDIPPVINTSLWGFVNMIASAGISLISLFTIIVAGGIVANEFSKGTIKLLLIRPYKRWKILLSKYISVTGFCLFMILILFIVSFITGGVLFGFEGVNHPYITYNSNIVKEVNMVAHVFGLYALNSVSIIMMVSLSFMISTVFRNSALSIGLAIFFTFIGGTVTNILTVLKVSWVKYILFANTNLTQYIDGVPAIEGMTLGFSVAVLVVYFLIFNTISFMGFIKRDVGI